MAPRISDLLIILTVTSISHIANGRQHPAAIPKEFMGQAKAVALEDWNKKAQDALNQALNLKLNTNVAKNVILFLGDGMGISTVTAGRIYAGQVNSEDGESYQLSFDKFPHVALSKTYNVNHQVPDSAGTATAYLCGEKANLGVIGVNQNVVRDDCNTMSEENNIDSILRWSITEGKRTGVVTTTRVTHATPAASYAHAPDRDYEGDWAIPTEHKNNPLCQDIAYQLINSNSDINLIMGGGRQYFMPNTTTDYEYEDKTGRRTDGKDLIEEWKAKMEAAGNSHAFLWNRTNFEAVDPETTDYVLGLFDTDHMQYWMNRFKDGAGEPTLPQMTDFAIRNLRRAEKGYFLLIEGGRIDQGHHDNWAKAALSETVALEEAVQVAVDLTSEDDTLIVVTADHSHVFTMGGYPTRNNSIIDFVDPIGILQATPEDGMPYTTLNYASGPTGALGRWNMSETDATSDDFKHPSQIPLFYETHGGEDVAIFARGPMSHLFHGVQEQNYIAHAMAYASCVGMNKEHCTNTNSAMMFALDMRFTFFLLLARFFLVR